MNLKEKYIAMKPALRTVRRILKNILIGLNETLNCCIRMNGEWGQPDEMLSARAWRLRATYPRLHIWINRIFWFDKDHCAMAYLAEQMRRDLPAEYQR